MPAMPPPVTSLSPKDIEIATRAADNFTRIYYNTYDSATRIADLPQFYRDTSSLTWNGTPYGGTQGVRNLIQNMPATRHEIQSFDCHPIPGSTPPALLISVSGTVVHGRIDKTSSGVDAQPRIFSQTFLLLHDSTVPIGGGEPAKYYVSADALRFVG